MVEHQVPVVCAVVAEFLATVAHLYACERLVRLQVSDLHQERLHATVIALRVRLRKDDCVIRMPAQGARPELGSAYRWRMNGEGLCLFIVLGSRLQARHVRAVTQLGLSVTSDDVQVVGTWQEMGLLSFGAKQEN